MFYVHCVFMFRGMYIIYFYILINRKYRKRGDEAICIHRGADTVVVDRFSGSHLVCYLTGRRHSVTRIDRFLHRSTCEQPVYCVNIDVKSIVSVFYTSFAFYNLCGSSSTSWSKTKGVVYIRIQNDYQTIDYQLALFFSKKNENKTSCVAAGCGRHGIPLPAAKNPTS